MIQDSDECREQGLAEESNGYRQRWSQESSLHNAAGESRGAGELGSAEFGDSEVSVIREQGSSRFTSDSPDFLSELAMMKHHQLRD